HDWVLGKILELRARTHADRPFLQYMERPALSFAEVNRIVNRIARGLANLGVRKGDRVLLMLPNCLEYLYAWWGANKLGAIEVPVNSAYKGYFLEHLANNSAARVMVIDQSFVEHLQFSEERLNHLEKVVVYSGEGISADQLPRFKRLEAHTFDSLYARDDTNLDIDVRYHDLAAIMYTSGTTGPSKGVMMPHAQCYFFSDQDVNLLRLTGEDIYYTCNPFFHANAQILTVYPCLIVGAKVVVYPSFRASEWIDHIRKSKATVANFLGVMMDFVYRQPPRPDDNDTNLRAIFAAPTPSAIVDDFKRRFGIEAAVECYGMTEICLPIMLPYGEYRPGAAGKLVSDWFEAKIVDPETDEELPVDTVGEFILRHKEPWTLNAGYYGMPDKTAEAYRNLWFHSGDGVKRDADGFYYFVDRIKDALRRRGENISSYEVEKVINDNPAVAESAVIAVKSEILGGEDEVKACVLLKPEARLAPGELLRWCEERMPYFAVPRYLEFVTELPKTPNLKIQKQKLRDAGLTADTWDRVKAGFKLQEEIKREQRKR
ncbi:MAG: AMP-binding protein, partial [Candidatus Binataceae bacterium]